MIDIKISYKNLLMFTIILCILIQSMIVGNKLFETIGLSISVILVSFIVSILSLGDL